jgi:NAD/NADP transhydrogenase beta subunit
MNRSALNVLFGAFGKVDTSSTGPAAEAKGTVRQIMYYDPKCMMLFGDAKDSLTKLLTALKW